MSSATRLHQFLDRRTASNQIDRPPQQILIEAKILEITLDEDESFGVDWSRMFDVDDGGATIGVRDFVTSGAGLFFDLMTSDIEVALNALTRQGRVRTLSTPRLLALEHQEAEVVIGERLGFEVTTTINQVTTTSVEFLESGVILRFKASVDRRGRIVLEIHPEVSTGTIVEKLPRQNTTEVTTTLRIKSGEGIFIAGLIQDRESESRKGVPFLSQIPLLGRLFTSTQSIAVNTETVVVLTAHLIDDGLPAVNAQMAEKTRRVEQQLRDSRAELEERFLPGLRTLLPQPFLLPWADGKQAESPEQVPEVGDEAQERADSTEPAALEP